MLTGYLGLLLMGSTFLAVGLFASSLTENQIVAAAWTFGILLLLWVIGWGADTLGGTGGKVLQHLSILEHNDNFAQGRARHEGRPLLRELHGPRAVPRPSLARSAAVEGMIRRLLDWGGYLGLGVLLATAILTFVYPAWMTRLRWWTLLAAGVLLVLASLLARVEDFRGLFGHRTTKYGVNTAVAIALVLGVTVVVQALSFRHSARRDLTENKRFSLSPQTIQLLRGLKTDVNAVAFYPQRSARQARGRGPAQAVRPVLEREAHVEERRPRP